MIFGACPHCDTPMTFAIPTGAKLPVFTRVICDNCDKHFFEKLSRIDPQAYLPEEVTVDENTKTIRVKEIEG